MYVSFLTSKYADAKYLMIFKVISAGLHDNRFVNCWFYKQSVRHSYSYWTDDVLCTYFIIWIWMLSIIIITYSVISDNIVILSSFWYFDKNRELLYA